MSAWSAQPALFGRLDRQAPDALLAVIGQHRADPRPDKIDVGVGVYRDAAGVTPVMRAVKAAEARLLAEQRSKSYLGPEGDQQFTDLLARIALGGARAPDTRITGVQTPGGTGALRLAAELIATADPQRSVWIGTPTWPNHGPIFRAAGLNVEPHAYYDALRSTIDFDAFITALAKAKAGDVVLLHGCCHNPTGTGFSVPQWNVVADHLVHHGLIPLIDLAYQGLGHGWDDDAAGTRHVLDSVPEAMVAYSCDKNFALYRERVGALWVKASSDVMAVTVRENMLVLARSLWSMPPDHGAAIVRTILEHPALVADWHSELGEMCARIRALRTTLALAHPALAPIGAQEGLFALLPIDQAVVARLRADHGIYMPASGRINIAGLNDASATRFVAALLPYLER